MKSAANINSFFAAIYEKSNKVIESLLIGYFVLGIGLSFFYDTYLIGIAVGLLNLSIYYSAKALFKKTRLNQYAASLVAGLFMAQFIYQMHGMFEMHFTAFIAIIALITYQNIYAFIPQLVFVLIHHSTFAYIQYVGAVQGVDSYKQIYFTQLDYMDFQTFLFHAGLYALGITIAAIYAKNLEKATVESSENILSLEKGKIRTQSNIEFANDIARGQLDINHEVDDKDELGVALLNMQKNLKESQEREVKEKFITTGIAKVSELIRNRDNNLEDLSDKLVTFLVKYLEANQAGIFIYNQEEENLEMKACYAYDRKKFLNKSINIGEGLVGQCYLEKERILLREIPENYVDITSGLGGARPSEVVIVPIKTEDSIEGILEIASLNKFNAVHLAFLDKVCENIAATIQSTKMNERTTELLTQSQQQTEELRAQEEEMRQNMEELQATQEEVQRTSKQTNERLGALDNSGVGMIEFDTVGNIVTANDTFCNLMGYGLGEIQGKHHRIFAETAYAQSDEYKKFWEDLGRGRPHKGQFERLTKSGKKVSLHGAYSILRDLDGQPSRIVKFVFNLTNYLDEVDSKREQLEIIRAEAESKAHLVEEQINALDNSAVGMIEFDTNGVIQSANETFCNLMGYKETEIINKHHNIFVDSSFAKTDEYRLFWEELGNGKSQKGKFTRYNKSGEEVTLFGSYSIISDQNGKAVKVLKYVFDLTNYLTEINAKDQKMQLLIAKMEEDRMRAEKFEAKRADAIRNLLTARKKLSIKDETIAKLQSQMKRLQLTSVVNKTGANGKM